MENATIFQKKDEHVFDDEMKKIILERAKDMRDNPDDWVDYKEAIEELRRGL